jgi:hypothetical protein
MFVFLFAIAEAQTPVKKQSEKIKGETLEGFATDFEGKRQEVANALSKVLKEHGKIKFLSTDPIVVTSPTLNGSTFPKGTLYATIREGNNGVTVWIGTKQTDWEASEAENITKQVEILVSTVGVQLKKDRVQANIDETQQALDAVNKQLSRAINQGNDLLKKQTTNAQDKIKLEQAIQANTLEAAVLKVKIETNKKAQDSLVSAATNIQQMKQLHEEKLKKIN